MCVCKLLVLKEVVGAKGFEPSTSWSRTRRASQAALRPDIHAQRYDKSQALSQLITAPDSQHAAKSHAHAKGAVARFPPPHHATCRSASSGSEGWARRIEQS
jgi:hypothetical protein